MIPIIGVALAMGRDLIRLLFRSRTFVIAVIYGGVSLLSFLINKESGYMDNPLRQNLFRAGHAHAGVLLVLSLVAPRYVDETELPAGWKQFVRSATPSAAILLPAGFFFSVLSPKATEPNALIYLAFIGAVVLAAGLVTLGVGLLKKARNATDTRL